MFSFIVIGAAAFPIVVLIPFQIFLVLKTKKTVLKATPLFICLLMMVLSLLFLPGQGILKILAVLYCILLCILCGTGWIIGDSILKSKRK